MWAVFEVLWIGFSPAGKRGTLVNSTVKTIMFWVFILVCLMLLWTVVQRSSLNTKDAEIPYSDLYDKVQQGQVQDAAIQGTEMRGHLKGSKDQFHTTIGEHYEDLEKAMLAAKVSFGKKDAQSNLLLPILFNAGPFILLGVIWFFFMRQMQATRR
jgi:cell division protease FtsH